jgi:hypothetical protein
MRAVVVLHVIYDAVSIDEPFKLASWNTIDHQNEILVIV